MRELFFQVAHIFLNSGRDKEESINPIVGTSAFVQGYGMANDIIRIARVAYVNIVIIIFLARLVSHNLSCSTCLLRFSIAVIALSS